MMVGEEGMEEWGERGVKDREENAGQVVEMEVGERE